MARHRLLDIVDFPSLVDYLFATGGDEAINAALKAAADGPMAGILGVSDEPCVSMDFKGDSRSSIVDAALTSVMGSRFAKVVSWYDNEWGYSCRVADLAAIVAGQL